jgi:hypothetical protein
MRQSTLRVARRQALESLLVRLRLLSCRTFNGVMDYRVAIKRVLVALVFSVAANVWNVQTQEFLPSPPSDKTLIYILGGENKLVALPFESGHTPLKITEKARSSKTSYLEIKGETAATTLPAMPRISCSRVSARGRTRRSSSGWNRAAVPGARPPSLRPVCRDSLLIRRKL